MTAEEKVRRALDVRARRVEELEAASRRHAKNGRLLPELLAAAKRFTNADHALGRAEQADRRSKYIARQNAALRKLNGG